MAPQPFSIVMPPSRAPIIISQRAWRFCGSLYAVRMFATMRVMPSSATALAGGFSLLEK
jgi:hypothetical protein